MSGVFEREDSVAESLMSFLNVSFEVGVVRLSQIDWNESANNCARMREPYNEEKVEEYQSSMVRGDKFPMPIIEKLNNGKYVILGGNQRLLAFKRYGVDESFSCYIVGQLISTVRDSLIRSLNARHGWGSDKSERIEHAVYLVRRNGLTVPQAAFLMVVAEATVNRHLKAEETRAELAKAGVSSNAFSDSQLCSIGAVNDIEARTALGRIVADQKLSADSISAAAKHINAAKSKAEISKRLSDYRKEALTANPSDKKTIKLPRRAKFLRLLRDANDFLERGNDGTGFSSLDELQCNPKDDGEIIRTMAKKIVIRLTQIAEV